MKEQAKDNGEEPETEPRALARGKGWHCGARHIQGAARAQGHSRLCF